MSTPALIGIVFLSIFAFALGAALRDDWRERRHRNTSEPQQWEIEALELANPIPQREVDRQICEAIGRISWVSK